MLFELLILMTCVNKVFITSLLTDWYTFVIMSIERVFNVTLFNIYLDLSSESVFFTLTYELLVIS